MNQSTKDLSQCLKDDDSTFYQNQVNKHSQMKLKIIADSLNLYEFIMTKAKQNKIKQNKTKQTKTAQNHIKTERKRIKTGDVGTTAMPCLPYTGVKSLKAATGYYVHVRVHPVLTVKLRISNHLH